MLFKKDGTARWRMLAALLALALLLGGLALAVHGDATNPTGFNPPVPTPPMCSDFPIRCR